VSHAHTTLPPERLAKKSGDVYVLLVTRGEQIGARFDLHDRAIIGRDTSCAIRLPESGVSRRHVEIRALEHGGHQLRDLGSMNGVRVNGAPVASAVLHSGDRVELGQSVELHYLLRDQHERERERDARLKILGQLAGSVAHDLNNLLSVLKTNLGVMEAVQFDSETAAQCASDMDAAIQQGAELVTSLLLFASQKEAPHEPVDLSRLVGEAIRLVRHRLPAQIALQLTIEPDVALMGNSARLLQVPHNLMLNAVDAMPGGGHLDVTLSTVVVTYDSPLSARLVPGRWACLTISDDGRGMDAQTMERIFEPYFTTRSQGSGVGLATVYGVIHEHAGTIMVSSAVGVGTTFKVYLPVETAGDADDLEDSTQHVAVDLFQRVR